MKATKKFPLCAEIQDITLVKSHGPELILKNVSCDFSSFFKKGVSVNIEHCKIISSSSSLNFDFSKISPATVGYFLHGLANKLEYFSSIKINHLSACDKEIFLQLTRQGMSWATIIMHKGEPLECLLTQEGDISLLKVDGLWEGKKIWSNAEINDRSIDLALKIDISSLANQSVVNFLGEGVNLSLRLEKFSYWQVQHLKIETSKGHLLQGNCLQKKGKLEGDFIWDMPLIGYEKTAKCSILVGGSADRPVIKWAFDKELASFEDISGECVLINDNHLKLSGILQRDLKNTASVKIDVFLSPFLVNGNISILSPDIHKLLHLFWPDAKGSLNFNATFEDVSSLERGHVVIEGQGALSDTDFHVSINIKAVLHNGLGNGELHLKNGRYKGSTINADLSFASENEQIKIEILKVQIQDMRFGLVKPAVYNFDNGLSKAQIQFYDGILDIEQLKFGDALQDTVGIIKFKNIQLHKLNTFFDRYSFAGVLNGYLQKHEGAPLSARLNLSKGFLKQSQDGHVYQVLNGLNAIFEAECKDATWNWSANIKDQDKINLETKGKLDTNSLQLDAFVKGLVRLKLVTDWLATDDRIFGDVTIDLRAVGQLNSPELKGMVNVDNGLYEHSEVGTFYQNITIRTKAEGKRLVVTRFDAHDVTKGVEPGVGELRGEGWIDFSELLSPVFNVPLHLSHLRIAQHDGFKSDATGTLIIAGKGAEVGCKGEVTLENAHYYLETSVETKVPRIVDKQEKEIQKKKVIEYSTAFPLDILIHAPPESFKVTGLGADTVWKGDFYVRKSIVNPFLVGTVYLHKGTLDILGKVLRITKGEITFVDTDRNNPRLDIKAVKKMGDNVTVAIEIRGTGGNTIVDFSSIPSMPKEEVLALLLFGKKLGEVSVLQSVQLAELANAESSGQGFFEKMRSNFGFDQFEFTTSHHGGASSTDEDATPQERAETKTSQAVRIGKEFGKIQVAIEQGAGSETSKLTVSTPLGKNLALQGDVGAAQNSGVGISWVKRY